MHVTLRAIAAAGGAKNPRPHALSSTPTSPVARNANRGRGPVLPSQEPPGSESRTVHPSTRVGGPVARRLAAGGRADAGVPRSGGSAGDGGAVEGRSRGEGVAVMSASYRDNLQATAPSKNCTVSGCGGTMRFHPRQQEAAGTAHAGVALAGDMGLPSESRPHRGRHPCGGEGVAGRLGGGDHD